MNVKAAAHAAGISPSGLRWYEAKGVLPPAPRGENGYRTYTEDDVSLLRLVVTLRRLGLSAPEAGRLARLALANAPGSDELPAALQRQREAIARQRADLDWLDGGLRDLEATLRATREHGGANRRPAPIAVLFLCNANSGRSQIGEALLTKIGGDRFAVHSAGASPTAVSPLAIEVLAEAGIDWHEARSKHIGDVRGPFDYVIALADSMRESCAAIPGPHSTLHWHLPDPAAAGGPGPSRLDAYRRIRDELATRLVPFVELALRTASAQEAMSHMKEASNG